ncbi:MAG: BON domain-containing protein [Desulfosarcina sp.]
MHAIQPSAAADRNRPAAALSIVLVAMLGLLSIAMVRPAIGAEKDDAQIRQAILRTVDSRTAISTDQMEIQVKDGIAMLSGSVGNLLQKKKAVEIAESIRGVRSVVDTITVEPVAREDQAIRRDVRRRIALTLNSRGADIDVAVSRGNVILTGVADSWAISRLAEHQAMAIWGVSGVDNQINIKAPLHREDAHIQADVQDRLAADLYVDGRLIETSVVDGRVTLKGVVGSVAEKRRAADDAWVAGVGSVDADALVVDWRESDRMRRDSPVVRLSDADVLKAVRDALELDPKVSATGLDVSVTDGTVTLTGVVDTLYAKQAAAADALHTAGVWRVDNQLDLRYRALPTEPEMLAMIRDVFERDAELHDQRIDVAVDDIHVTLTGTVATMGQKVRAENIVSQIEGVLSLDNRLTVKRLSGRKRLSDAETAERIATQFLWSPFVDGDRIDVAVINGQAFLEGRVTNRFVAYTAVENAFEGGADKVRAKLTVDDGHAVDELFNRETFHYRPAGSLFSFLP